jgi:hypothetical protein
VPALSHVRADHDETLVARLAANDLAARELEAARAQVAECPACAQLLVDLRSISSATSALPAPRRTRDFRLTEADAARLRPAGWRGLLARLGSPGFAFARPLAGGLAALGIAGLILASLPSGFGGAGGASQPIFRDAAGGAATSAAPAAAPALVPDASGDGRITTSEGPGAVPGATNSVGMATATDSTKGGSQAPEVAAAPGATANGTPADLSARPDQGASAQSPSPLLVLSVVLLGSALVLGGFWLIGRRLA